MLHEIIIFLNYGCQGKYTPFHHWTAQRQEDTPGAEGEETQRDTRQIDILGISSLPKGADLVTSEPLSACRSSLANPIVTPNPLSKSKDIGPARQTE